MSRIRKVLLGAVVSCASASAAASFAACGDDAAERSTDAAADAGSEPDTGPSWLGDAGLLERAPVARPLHELCGIASNPGDMPLGADARSASLRKGYFDAALDLGGVMIRRDFLWSQIEPERGRFTWDRYDALVAEASARGVRLLGLLAYGVPWANAATVGGRDTFPPDDPDDFAAFARAASARWRGKVAAWEIWNEPNNGFRFWEPTTSGDPAAYARLLVRAHAAVKEASPETPVLLGGTVFTPQLIEGAIPWLERAYAAEPALPRSFDVAGIHTYALYPPQRAPELGEGADPPLEAKIQMHAWLLAKHGAGDRPMWITELGWPTWGEVDAPAQARLMVRATILAVRAGASGVFWYTLRDGPNPTAFPPEDAFGLLGNDHVAPSAADGGAADGGASDGGASDGGREATPKPVYRALRALLRTVGERWATAERAPVTGLPADGHAVVFRGASGPEVIAAWTVTTPSASVVIDRAGEVLDLYGDRRGAVARGGALPVGPDVTYVVAAP